MQLSSLKNQILVLLKNKTALNYNTGANTFQNIRFKLFFLFGTADALAVVTVFEKREHLIARCYPPSLMVFLHIQYFLHFESFSLKQNIAFAGGGDWSHHHHFSQKCIRCVPIYFVQESSVTFQLNFD